MLLQRKKLKPRKENSFHSRLTLFAMLQVVCARPYPLQLHIVHAVNLGVNAARWHVMFWAAQGAYLALH